MPADGAAMRDRALRRPDRPDPRADGRVDLAPDRRVSRSLAGFESARQQDLLTVLNPNERPRVPPLRPYFAVGARHSAGALSIRSGVARAEQEVDKPANARLRVCRPAFEVCYERVRQDIPMIGRP